MKKVKKILVTGGTGLLGKGLIETSAPAYQIVSVHLRKYAVKDPKATHLTVDLCDKRSMEKLFSKYDFDTVVHAAGIANVDYVEKNYAESLESNLVGTLNITSACRRRGIHLIYISTNAVFDGKAAPYDESAQVGPINKYGAMKVECEKVVTQTLQNFTIVRPILMYGWNQKTGRPNPATWILEKLQRGEKIQMVNDVYENPLYNIQCAEALWSLIEKKVGNIFHFAGGEICNRYEFALKVAKVFSLNPSLIQQVDSSYFPSIAPRPKNTSFITKRMENELGVKPVSIEEGLRHMKERSPKNSAK